MFIQEFNERLNKEIARGIISEFLKKEYFNTTKHNKQSEAHSRVLAIIVKVCFDLGFDVEIERRYNYNINDGTKSFKPDVSIYKENKLYAFIEYESTNSSDSRFYNEGTKCILRNFKKYSLSDNKKEHSTQKPESWIIIFTLPRNKVDESKWESWDYKEKRINEEEFQRLCESPYKYYFEKYIEETKKIIEKTQTNSKIYLLNVNTFETNQIVITKEFPIEQIA